MRVLVTGGAGYIGSHACVELIQSGHDVVVVDNLANSKVTAIDRVRDITGKDLTFFNIDILDVNALEKVFKQFTFDAVIHFAGLKSVSESSRFPLYYYENNITGTINLCRVMEAFGVKNLVFSSSATVYGDPALVPITEDFPLSATNPYGRTKLYIEELLRDLHASDNAWNIALLRYFNPVGAHPSGKIGEDPNGIPNNLLPYITQVAVGRLAKLHVFGGNYPTRDGTGVRDYIHVVDLARGHLKALEKLKSKPGCAVWNLGTGEGYSVLEVLRSFEQVSGLPIPFEIVDRRPGDVAQCYADPRKAKEELGWSAQMGVEKMCADAWNWQSQNPNGYEDVEDSCRACGV